MAQELLWKGPEHPVIQKLLDITSGSSMQSGKGWKEPRQWCKLELTEKEGLLRACNGHRVEGPLGNSSWVSSKDVQGTFYKALLHIFAERALGLPIQNWPSLQNKQRSQGHNLSLGCGKASKVTTGLPSVKVK